MRANMRRKKKVPRETAYMGARAKAEKNINNVLEKYPNPQKLFEAVFGRKPKDKVFVKKVEEPFPCISFGLGCEDFVKISGTVPRVGQQVGITLTPKDVKIQSLGKLVQISCPPYSLFGSREITHPQIEHEAEHIFQTHSRRWDSHKEFGRAVHKFKEGKVDESVVVNSMRRFLNDEIGGELRTWRRGGQSRIKIVFDLERLQKSAKISGIVISELWAEIKERCDLIDKARFEKDIPFQKILEVQRKSTWKTFPENLKKLIEKSQL